MKLLFDENLSHRLVDLLAAEFPGSAHPRQLGMRGASDLGLWEYAREKGFAIVSKDSDFRQRVFLDGPPPKVIWLSIGGSVLMLLFKGFKRRCQTRNDSQIIRLRYHAFSRA